jgi:predicted naringenin-chalcone synthase
MTLAILGLGTAVPDTEINQHDALRIARVLCCRTPEQATWLPGLYGHAGIESRHSVLGQDVVRDVLEGTRRSGSPFLPIGSADDHGPSTAERMRHYREAAGPLTLRAARAALEESRLGAETLTHLVTVSCTGFHAPGVDLALIEGLGMPRGVQRTHIGYMGCHGALNGLRVAHAYAEAEPGARVLLCAVELCSLHYHYGWDPQKVVANALFADGAAAVVGAWAEGNDPALWRVSASGSYVFPASADAMTWTVGDHGFEMTLSKRVPNLIASQLRPWLEGWLAENGLSVRTVGSWAIHPGGPRILDAVAESLELGQEQTADARAVLARCGNMSSPTVLFILHYLRARRAARPCVALAFGPGLAVEAALLR